MLVFRLLKPLGGQSYSSFLASTVRVLRSTPSSFKKVASTEVSIDRRFLEKELRAPLMGSGIAIRQV